MERLVAGVAREFRICIVANPSAALAAKHLCAPGAMRTLCGRAVRHEQAAHATDTISMVDCETCLLRVSR